MVRRQIRPLLKIADKAGSHSRRPKENTAFPVLIGFIVFPSSAARLDTANHSGYSELLCKNLPSGYAASMTHPQMQNQHPQQILRFFRNVGSGLTPSCPAGRRRKKQTLPGGKFPLPQEPYTLYKERRKIKAEAPSAEAEGRRV